MLRGQTEPAIMMNELNEKPSSSLPYAHLSKKGEVLDCVILRRGEIEKDRHKASIKEDLFSCCREARR